MTVKAEDLVVSGVPDVTAREIVAQIGAATGNPTRLMAYGIAGPLAVELASQITAASINPGRLSALGFGKAPAGILAAG